MKQIIYLTILVFCINNLNSQTLKTYSGAFGQGQATYQYYEDENFERIYHGSFTYKDFSISIKGSFKNNLREGTWIAEKNYYTSSIADEPQNILVNAQYKNGKLDGICDYTMTNNETKKVTKKSTVTFSENTPIGKPIYFKENSFSYDAFLDSNGLLNGKAIHKYGLLDNNSEFKNGYLIWQLERDRSTGEKIKMQDRRAIYDTVMKYFDSNKGYALVPFLKINFKDNPDYVNKQDKIINPSFDLDTAFVKRNYYHYNSDNSKDTITYKNVPLKFAKTSDYDVVEIWNTQYTENPLYKFDKGIIPFEDKVTTELYLLYDEYSVIIEKAQELRKLDQEESIKSEERKYEENQEKLRIENSPYMQIQRKIKNDFNIWLQQQGSESASEYKQRVTSQYKPKLESITNDYINKFQKEQCYKYKNRRIVLGKYDYTKGIFCSRTLNQFETNSKDSINLLFDQKLAEVIKTTYSSFDDICLVPQTFSFIDYYPVLTSATVIFGRFFERNSGNNIFTERIEISKDQKNSSIAIVTRNNEWSALNIKTVKSIKGQLLYYDWNLIDQDLSIGNMIQPMSFTLEQLDIKLPF